MQHILRTALDWRYLKKSRDLGGQRGKEEERVYDVFINSSPSKKISGGEERQTEIPVNADVIIVLIFAKIILYLKHKLA